MSRNDLHGTASVFFVANSAAGSGREGAQEVGQLGAHYTVLGSGRVHVGAVAEIVHVREEIEAIGVGIA